MDACVDLMTRAMLGEFLHTADKGPNYAYHGMQGARSVVFYAGNMHRMKLCSTDNLSGFARNQRLTGHDP